MKNEIKAIVNAILSHNAGDHVYSDIKELIVNVNDSMSSDFLIEFDGREYRVICQDDVDQILKDELSSDEYVLGYAQAWFLSDVMDIPVEAIEKIQKADCSEALGTIIANNPEMLSKYINSMVSCDGYGHHFSSYDGSETEAGNYLVFCVN